MCRFTHIIRWLFKSESDELPTWFIPLISPCWEASVLSLWTRTELPGFVQGTWRQKGYSAVSILLQSRYLDNSWSGWVVQPTSSLLIMCDSVFCFFSYPDPNASLPEGVSAVDVAALIKCYIASLPEPLTTFELLDDIRNARSSIHSMRNILKKLPTVNYMTLELITALLLRVSQKFLLNKVWCISRFLSSCACVFTLYTCLVSLSDCISMGVHVSNPSKVRGKSLQYLTLALC